MENTQFLGEATWHANKFVDLTGGFGYGDQKPEQSSIENPNAGISDTSSVAPWTAILEDKSNYGFARLDWWAQPKKLQISAEYTFIRDFMTYDFAHVIKPSASGIILANVASTTAINLAPSFSRTHDVALSACWHYTPQVDLGCTYGFTQYDYQDPLSQGIPYLNVNPTNVGTAASGIFLGTNRSEYKAHRFQVSATRRF